jgi:radical SAM protein with 4Fe4S-binding SPASM domain
MEKIKYIQFDPNGFCNAKCWYCPVRYEPLPKYQNMKISDVDIIFNKIINSKFVDDDLLVYTAHYNEFLLYPYIEEFFGVLRKYNIKTLVLSNGTNLTPDKLDLLNRNKDVIVGINLNIPAINKEQWINQVGLDDYQYDKLINNLDYISNNNLTDNITIGMNGIDDSRFLENDGNLSKLEKFPDYIESTTIDCEFNEFKLRYPSIEVYKNLSLVDRNSLLEKNNIYSTTVGNLLNNKKWRDCIIGCNNGNRFDQWTHINSFGDVFLCCNDYNYDYIYGNLLKQEFDDIWESDHKKQIIKKAKSEICENCTSTIWK